MMKLQTTSLLFVVAATAASKPCGSEPTVTIDSGPVVGVATDLPKGHSRVAKFLGIPFSGKTERFTLSKPPQPWTEPFKADSFGASCPQYYVVNDLIMDPATMRKLADGDPNYFPPESDDCLFINVFAPAPKGHPIKAHGKAVLVYIHGGGWNLGNGIADLSTFAADEDIVAVSFNYRTNIFGFPNAPDLPVQERNLGLHDQQLAMEWVQKNIAAFGGDPSRVTLWGVSAGSMSIDDHLHAFRDSEHPPFRAVIQASGQASWGWLANTANSSDTSRWSAVSNQLGCDKASSELECMRKATIDDLKNAANDTGASYSPVIDEVTVTSQQAKAWREGNVLRVPVLTSTTWEEGRGLLSHEVELGTFMDAYFPVDLIPQEMRDGMVSYYMSQPDAQTDFDIAAAIFTDFLFQCGQALEAEASAALDNPTWRFIFNQTVLEILPPEFHYLGKFHGSDAVLLLGLTSVDPDVLPLEIVRFRKYYVGMLADFIRDPESGPGWPQVGAKGEAPFDIASLGQVGDEHFAGARVVNRSAVDQACVLYKEIYKLLEKYVLS